MTGKSRVLAAVYGGGKHRWRLQGDFTLTDAEMTEIAALDKGVRYYHRTDEQLIQFAGWKPAFEVK